MRRPSCRKRCLETQRTINDAESEFADNQASGSGNLTRLGRHIALMNGKDLAKQTEERKASVTLFDYYSAVDQICDRRCVWTFPCGF